MAVELQNYGRMLRVPIISITIFSFDEGQEILESLHADTLAQKKAVKVNTIVLQTSSFFNILQSAKDLILCTSL